MPVRRVSPLVGIVAVAAVMLSPVTLASQETASRSTVIAFRADANHVVATVRTLSDPWPEGTEPLSPQPLARLGYRYFAPAVLWAEQNAPDMHAGDRWLIHAASGEVFQAETERIVAGNVGCQGAVGALLRVAPDQSQAFAAIGARYFLAEHGRTPQVSKTPSRSSVGVAPSPSTAEFRRAVESILGALLARELPRVITDAAPEQARAASSDVTYLRSWARQQQAADEAMQDGRGRLKYDIQSFRLAPDGVLVHFVRAEWLVGQRQGFAASLWLRGERPVTVVESSVRPAEWLRMSEFQGTVTREHLGLVLDVFDRNHDGWGEVLVEQSGYESMTLSVVEYSEAGFSASGIEYGGGC